MINTWNPAEISDKLNQLEGQIKANDVIANPTGEATETLTKIEIDGDIYSFTAATSAADVSYDNTSSDLEADDVQDAIDEIVTDLGNLIKTETLTATTTAAGIFNITSMGPEKILSVSAAPGTEAYCLARSQSTAGKSSILVVNSSFQPIASTEVSLVVTHL